MTEPDPPEDENSTITGEGRRADDPRNGRDVDGSGDDVDSRNSSGDTGSVRDPVRQRLAGELDLYDIATWENRTWLDSIAVSLVETYQNQKRTALLALALSLFLGQIAVVSLFVLEEPLLGVLSVLSVLPALLLVFHIWTSDPTEREPVTLLAATFLLAAILASFAAVVNSTFLPGFEVIPLLGLPLFYFLVVGPIEEFVKWLAVRIYAYNSDTFRTVIDGAVYGAVAGLGFAAIENVMYIVYFSVTVTPVETIIEQQYAISIAVTRSFVGPGHVIFSAWAGFYLGLAKFNPSNRGPIVVKGLLVASFIHATYNTLVLFVPMTGLSFLLFILVYHGFWLTLLYRKIATYRELYRSIKRPGSQ